MARVTVEDCLTNVDNRFTLVLVASKRAHLLEMGAADPLVTPDNDKPTVIALREIASGHDITQTRTDHVEDDLLEGLDHYQAKPRITDDEIEAEVGRQATAEEEPAADHFSDEE